jgi:hypothetical protein
LELCFCWKLLVAGLVSLRVLELICNSSLAAQSPCYNKDLPVFRQVCVFVADTELGNGLAHSCSAGMDLSGWSELKMNL